MRENSPGGKPVMPMKRYKPEQIVNLLRQIEVEIANGKTTPQACKEAEITVQSYYRWRKEYGGLKLDQAKRLKELTGGTAFEAVLNFRVADPLAFRGSGFDFSVWLPKFLHL
jgi:hypothetical protein